MPDQTFGFATKALIKKDGKYLLLYKSETEDINPNSYDIPGGRLKFGENPIDALKREVKEEVGLTIEPQQISEVWTFVKEDFQLVGVTFVCEFLEGNVVISDEHSKSEWTDASEINESDKYPGWLKKSIKKAESISR